MLLKNFCELVPPVVFKVFDKSSHITKNYGKNQVVWSAQFAFLHLPVIWPPGLCRSISFKHVCRANLPITVGIVNPSVQVDCNYLPSWAVNCYYGPSCATVHLDSKDSFITRILAKNAIPITCPDTSAAAPFDVSLVTRRNFPDPFNTGI